eukprot:TRINITY_DN11304_c0_g2_i2.p1 TRINITY_DN11304_c0_g2~~TRINITY_DN11304_c0_g2_i2.p1  ORF type:complete len:222 (+),score=66.36 TRINITY_DN11304_c0_g2_i2:307-972(+)
MEQEHEFGVKQKELESKMRKAKEKLAKQAQERRLEQKRNMEKENKKMLATAELKLMVNEGNIDLSRAAELLNDGADVNSFTSYAADTLFSWTCFKCRDNDAYVDLLSQMIYNSQEKPNLNVFDKFGDSPAHQIIRYSPQNVNVILQGIKALSHLPDFANCRTEPKRRTLFHSLANNARVQDLKFSLPIAQELIRAGVRPDYEDRRELEKVSELMTQIDRMC